MFMSVCTNILMANRSRTLIKSISVAVIIRDRTQTYVTPHYVVACSIQIFSSFQLIAFSGGPGHEVYLFITFYFSALLRGVLM